MPRATNAAKPGEGDGAGGPSPSEVTQAPFRARLCVSPDVDEAPGKPERSDTRSISFRASSRISPRTDTRKTWFLYYVRFPPIKRERRPPPAAAFAILAADVRNSAIRA